MNAQQIVRQSALLTAVMGRWPSFHDAKVVSVSRSSDNCLATIHIFEMTNKVDSKGYFVLSKHHLVAISMQGVRSNSLPEPYKGDVLAHLGISRVDDLVEVAFESHMDQGGSVLCKEVEITSVTPCAEDGRVRT